MKVLSYGRQWINDDDIDAVVKVLKGDWLTMGPTVEEFEKALADYAGVKQTGRLRCTALWPRRSWGMEITSSLPP